METYQSIATRDYEKTLVCNKGDIVLESYNYIVNNKKAYSLFCNFDNINTSNINVNALLSSEIYILLEKINPELIEQLCILKQENQSETDICILLKPIAKEIGIKQKYILFRTSKYLDIENKKVVFDNFFTPSIPSESFSTSNSSSISPTISSITSSSVMIPRNSPY